MLPKDIPSYVEWVIEQKPELRGTPEDVKLEVKAELTDRLGRLINAALLTAMPESELPHFERLLVHGTDDDVQRFCQQVIPDMEEIVAGVLIQFRNEYVGV